MSFRAAILLLHMKEYSRKLFAKFKNVLTAAGAVFLPQAMLLGAYSIWLEEQSTVPVVWVVE